MAYDNPETLLTLDVLTLARYHKLRDSIIADSHAVFPLGGSRSTAIPNGGGYQDAPDYIEFEVPTTSYTGFVYQVIVEIRTENASTTVTPKLRKVSGTPADAVIGAAGTSTAWGTYQTLTFTVAAGERYRLMASKSDDAVAAWIIGYVRRKHA